MCLSRSQFVSSLLVLGMLAACSHSGSSSDPQGAGSPPPSCPQMLSMPFIPQETPEWCWAACAQMVIESFGASAQQCILVDNAIGSPPGYCCTFPQACQTPAQRTTIQQLVLAYTGKTSITTGGPISLEQIMQNIDACSPVVILYADTTLTTGHFVVVHAYNSSAHTLDIYDPILGPFTGVPYGTAFTYGGVGATLVWATTTHDFH